MQTQAYAEYQRIKSLSAFSVDASAKCRKVNQYMRRYTFPDGSILEIFKSGAALVPNVVIGQLRVNAFGN